MKFKSYFLLGFAALALAACDKDFGDWTEQAVNEQDAITEFTAANITVSTEAAAGIDFANVNEGDLIKVANVTAPQASVEGYTPSYQIVLGGTHTYDLTANGEIKAEDLKAYIEEVYGKAPDVRTISAVVITTFGSSALATRYTSNPFDIKANLLAPHISENYYVVGGALEWGPSAASKEQKFKHSDQNVYDDPIFTITIPASFDADGNRTDTWFAIGDDEACDAITNNDDWSKLLGTTAGNGMNGYTGNLAPRTEIGNDGSLMLPASDEAVAYKITLNMMDYAFSIEPVSAAPETWYLVGGCIGDGSWGNAPENIGTAIFPLAYIGDKKIAYTGYFTTDGFKLIKTPGSWDDQWGWNNGYVKNDGGSGNLWVETAGWYTVTLDYVNDVLTIEPAAEPTATYEVGIAGSFNGWSFQAMTKCTGSDHLWKIDLTADGDQKGKFLIDGWSVNWGAADFPSGIGTQNGPDIPIAAGNYVVVFNDITGGYNFISK
ncbi:MAG: DUF5115 domain-containing protein [Prevotella sp.]|nr:DUF5115 domain-containing protein [Prevotella sp.]